MDDEQKDVKENSSNSQSNDNEKVEDSKSDDKITNFAILRKQKEELEAENAILRQKYSEAGLDINDRTLGAGDDEGTKDEEVKKSKAKETSSEDFNKALFQRDMKKAVRAWNTKNKVTAQEWSDIQKRVSLKGDELDDEIYQKIDDAYHSLPQVREKKEKELIERGKKEAMREFSDDELDLGVGGSDSGYDSVKGTSRFNKKTTSFAKGLGLSDKELKEVDPDANTASWRILDPKYRE